MSQISLSRTWCYTCCRLTTWRRYAAASEPIAKTECTECGPNPSAPTDWVDLAIRLAGKRHD